MSRTEHERLMEVFRGAADLDGADLEIYLDDACGGDAGLRLKVERLLELDASDSDAFDEAGVAVGRAVLDGALPPRIGQYRPIRVLGHGGMGIVYEAEQESPHRTVALKMIRSGAMSRQHVRRFRLEAELLGRLKHPGIAQIYEAGTIDSGEGGQPFFAMELIEGSKISTHVREHGLGTSARLELFLQVCDAVQHAHGKGIVHRDLKPDNILVDANGQVRILDFGVARATDQDIQVTTVQTDAGSLIGTVPYMSPEQVTGTVELVDTRSDVYALGVVLFELLAERLPHDLRGRSIVEAARIIREDDPTRLGSVATTFRGDLDVIVGKALEKEPNRRYQTAAEVAADIRRYLASEPISARRPTTVYQLRRFARRHRPVVIGAGVALVALVTGMVAAIVFAVDARNRAEESEWTAYRSQVASAAAAFWDGDVESARGFLDAVPDDRSGWEIRYLRSCLNPTILTREAAEGSAWTAPHWTAATGPRAIEHGRAPARVVDVRDGTIVRELDGVVAGGTPRVSGDGTRVAAQEPDTATIHVWSVDGTGHWTIDPRVGPEHLGHFELDDTGARLAFSTSVEGENVHVVDVETGERGLAFETTAWAIFSFDRVGDRFAILDDRNRWIMDLAGGEVVSTGRVDMGRASSIELSPDGRWLATSSTLRRTLEVVRADTHEVVLTAPRLRTPPTRPSFSANVRLLAVPRRLAVDLWDLDTVRFAGSLRSPVDEVCFDPAGDRLLATSPTTLHILDRRAAAPVTVTDTTFLYLVAFSPDGSLLATLGFSGRIRLLDVLEGEVVGDLPTARHTPRVLSFTEDGARVLSVCSGGDNVHESWDVTTSARRREQDTDDWSGLLRPGGAAVIQAGGVGLRRSRDGTRVAHAGWGAVVDFDVRLTPKPMSDPALAAAVSPDHRLMAVGLDGGGRLLDAATGGTVRELAAPAGELIYSIVFSLDGTRVVGAGRSGAIHFWDVVTGDLVCSMELHDDYVHHVTFSDDGTRLATASGDGTAKILDTVSYADRDRERAAMRERRAARRATISIWLAEGIDREVVAERLRADASLTSADRRVLYAEIAD